VYGTERRGKGKKESNRNEKEREQTEHKHNDRPKYKNINNYARLSGQNRPIKRQRLAE
jgi:hypothetical protein